MCVALQTFQTLIQTNKWIGNQIKSDVQSDGSMGIRVCGELGLGHQTSEQSVRC